MTLLAEARAALVVNGANATTGTRHLPTARAALLHCPDVLLGGWLTAAGTPALAVPLGDDAAPPLRAAAGGSYASNPHHHAAALRGGPPSRAAIRAPAASPAAVQAGGAAAGGAAVAGGTDDDDTGVDATRHLLSDGCLRAFAFLQAARMV